MDRIQDREFAPQKRVLITAFCKEGWGPEGLDERWEYIDKTGTLVMTYGDNCWAVDVGTEFTMGFHINDMHVLADEPKPQVDETKTDEPKTGDIVRCLNSFGGPKEIEGMRGIVHSCENGMLTVNFGIVPGRERPYDRWLALVKEESKTWERAGIELGDTVEVLRLPTEEDPAGYFNDEKVKIGSTGIVHEVNEKYGCIRVKFDHGRVWAFMPGQITAVKLNNG